MGAMTQGMLVYDSTGRILLANHQAAQLFYSENAHGLLQQTLHDVLKTVEIVDELKVPYALEDLLSDMRGHADAPIVIGMRALNSVQEEYQWVRLVQSSVTSNSDSNATTLLLLNEYPALPSTSNRFWGKEIQSVTAALSEGATFADVAHAFLDKGVPSLKAAGGALWLLSQDGTSLKLVDALGYSAIQRGVLSIIPLSFVTPPGDCIRGGDPLWISGYEQIERDYPEVARVMQKVSEPFSAAFLPLRIEGRAIGVASLHFVGDSAVQEQLNHTLMVVARQCAQALDRARLLEVERALRAEAEAGQHRLAFLAEASRALVLSLDYEMTLNTMLELLIPRLGDVATLDIITDEHQVRRLVLAPGDAHRATLLRRSDWPELMGENNPTSALSTPQACFFPQVDDLLLAKLAVSPTHLDLMQQLSCRSLCSVPIIYRNQLMGAVTVYYTTSSKQHTIDDLHLLEELAQRVASAMDNARLYQASEAAVRLRDDFLSVAGHELRTPLTALSLQLYNMRRVINDPARISEKLIAITRQSERLCTLVDELLDVSRVVAGRMNLNLERFDIGVMLKEIMARFADEAARFGDVLNCQCEGDLVGVWDPLRLEQVMSNLISNALRYGEHKPISARAWSKNGHVAVSVTDSGIGISSVDQQRIFQRFERAVSNRNYGGLGLGLWIAHQIVEAHGGTISVQSSQGQGSTFLIELPRMTEQHPEESSQALDVFLTT